MRKSILAAVSLIVMVGTAPSASAATIMLKGSNSNADITAFLTSNGHTVVPNSDIYTGVDTVILLRTGGNANLMNFVLGGGRLVTEWSGADWAMSSLLGGSVSGGGHVGSNTPVTFTAAGHAAGLSAGVGTTYSAAHASEFFRNFSSLGTGSVLATRPGNVAAIVGGTAGSGYVIANGIDWADGFAVSGDANRRVLLNSIAGQRVGAVPEPATWAMMILGLGAIGGMMRARRRQNVSVSYA